MSTQNFEAELISYQQPLTYFARTFTKSEDDAKDLVQETFVKAIRYRDKFEEKTNLKAWLYTIMKNTFINNYRKASRANTIIDQTKELYFLNIPQDSGFTSPREYMEENEIMKTVQTLEDDYKVPFMMHFEGFKYKEIADELDLPIGTVKSRIFLARKQLMELLKDYK